MLPATGPEHISPLAVVLATTLIVFTALLSLVVRLKLHCQILVAAARCILQLGILGYILKPIFLYNAWWLVVGYAFLMLLVGTFEAYARPAYTYKGMLVHIFICLGSYAATFLAFAMMIIIQIHPWYQPQYFIPVLGMLLGSAISGISIGLSTILEELSSDKDRLELLLSLGASRWEATQSLIQRACKVALTPILNQMNIAGLVSIPGMMTGQILGGSDPLQAARYQMIVMFTIAATTAMSSVSAIGLATSWIVDGDHQIISARLSQRNRIAFKVQHNMPHNAVHEYNAMMRGLAHAAAMQGHWQHDEFRQLESVRAGAKQMPDHRRVKHEQK
ncbi:hypothetical protein WJX74_009557 [Apatococcus lobatus]|uniref:Uncharacterized protein n=1 Tax=Apatococcus lobatus TaxID=904363 RepID=A0AAW1RK11_9CHLO